MINPAPEINKKNYRRDRISLISSNPDLQSLNDAGSDDLDLSLIILF